MSRNVDALLDIADRHGIEVVSSRAPAERAGIVVLAPADPQRVGDALAAAGIQVTVRSGAVRVAPHAGTSAETLGLFDAALADAGEFTGP